MFLYFFKEKFLQTVNLKLQWKLQLYVQTAAWNINHHSIYSIIVSYYKYSFDLYLLG